MIEAAFIVALGLLVTMSKVSWSAKFWMTSHPLLMDVVVFVFLTAIHWGTFSGVMAATGGALMCSVVLSIARRVIGYITVRDGQRVYVRGFFNLIDKVQ